MLKNTIGTFFLVILSTLNVIYGQDTLTILATGKMIPVEVDSITEDYIYYKHFKKKRVVNKVNDLDSFFSLKKKNGEEVVFYKKDESKGFELTEQEMRYYILGMQDARNGYKNPWITVVSFAAGAGLAYVADEGPYIFAIPFGSAVIAGLPGVNYTNKSERSDMYKSQAAYQSGYLKRARSRKITNALIGSCSGILTGLILKSELE